jgi:lipopolysaccharide export system permease protein
VELIGNIRFAERNALDPLPFQSALWYRLSYPVAILAILLAALPFAFSNLRSGGAGKRLFIGMLIGVAFFFLQRTSANLFETYRWALWAGYLAPPLVMALFGLWLLRRV